MNFWKKKNKIEFFNDELSIIETYPIIEYKDLKLEWVKRARQDFQNIVKDGGDKTPGFGHLTKCPGIFELFKYGYVIRLHIYIMSSANYQFYHHVDILLHDHHEIF